MSDTTTATGVSGRYATALFELAKESNALEAISADIESLGAAIDDSADLRAMIGSPIYTREQQQSAIAAIADKMGAQPVAKNFLALLAQKGRLYMLPEIARDFAAMTRADNGVVEAQVRSAQKLTEDQRNALKEKLKSAAGGEIVIHETVDETLLGGLVVQLGSKMVDASLRHRLDQLQTVMKEASL